MIVLNFFIWDAENDISEKWLQRNWTRGHSISISGVVRYRNWRYDQLNIRTLSSFIVVVFQKVELLTCWHFFLFEFYALHESLSNLCTQDFCLICNKITVLRKLSDSCWSDSYPVSVREYVNSCSYSWVPWNQCVKHCNFTCALAIWHIYTFAQTYSGSPSKG